MMIYDPYNDLYDLYDLDRRLSEVCGVFVVFIATFSRIWLSFYSRHPTNIYIYMSTRESHSPRGQT